MIGCLRTRVRVRKQPIFALYFESENELKFYYLEARKYSYLTSMFILVLVRHVSLLILSCIISIFREKQGYMTNMSESQIINY